MKNLKKTIVSIGLAACTLLSTGCNTGTSSSGPDVQTGNQNIFIEGSNLSGELTIAISDMGYGIKWLQDMATVFTAANPDLTINIKPTVLPHSLLDQIIGGLEGYDLFFMTSGLHRAYEAGVLEPLNDVFAAKPQGEDKTIAEKMDPMRLSACRIEHDVNSDYISMSWANSVIGNLVNYTTLDTIFGKGNYTVPVTTDEWIAFADEIKEKGAYTIIYAAAESYMTYMLETLWAQYEGDDYLNYFEGMYYNENGELVEADDGQSLESKGKLEALKVCEQLMSKSNGYVHENANSMNFAEAQAAFCGLGYGFANKKLVAFMPNGSWFENEVRDILIDYPQDIRMERFPIISAIIEKAPDQSIENDAELAALIRAIDKGETALSGDGYSVTQNDYDCIYKARKMINDNSDAHMVGLIKNSNNKEAAKEFLKFFASDAASQIYANSTYGLTLPYGYVPMVTEAVSSMVKSFNAIASDNTRIPISNRRRLTRIATSSVSVLSDLNGWSSALFSGAKTADDLYNEDIAYYKSIWSHIAK